MLDLGFRPELLYCAWRLDVTFALRDGTSKQGFGTAFAIRRHSGAVFFITARHLLDPELAVPKHVGAMYAGAVLRGRNYGGVGVDDEELELKLEAPPIFHTDPALDVAALAIEPPMSFSGGSIMSFLKQDELAQAHEFEQDIRAGDFLAAPGFSSLPFVDTDRPVLLTGVVASNPKYPVSVHRSVGPPAHAVLYQSLSRSGLSGAPVFATQRGLKFGDGIQGPPHRPGRLVGINGGGFLDASAAPLQFSYFTRSDAIFDLLNGPNVRPEQRHASD